MILPQRHQEKCQDMLHQHYPLAFSEISPKWGRRLEQEQQPFPFSKTWLKWYSEIRQSSKCVVGEAYGESSEYLLNCRECRKFCMKFMHSFLLNWYSRLEENKNLFVKHWNQKHIDYTYGNGK